MNPIATTPQNLATIALIQTAFFCELTLIGGYVG
jgi:hypothetical protein